MTKSNDEKCKNKEKCHPHKAYELSSDDDLRLQKLFEKLDSSGKGKINANELSKSLNKYNIPHRKNQIEVSLFENRFTIRMKSYNY